MRVLGICSYNGTAYYGWQKQVGYTSVQSQIEGVLSQILDMPINIVGSGRTDAGVHAFKQYFHFDMVKEKDLNQLAYSTNKMLPDDIKILSFSPVSDDFHARYNAKKKVYQYRLLLKGKDPFLYDRAWLYPMAFDFELFKSALKKFEGKHCYQDFTSKEEDEDGFVRDIYEIKIEKNDDQINVTFVGNGFMRYQIRNMIGTAVTIASKKEDISFIDEHLDSDKRVIVSYKSPASGLYLMDVLYK